MGHPIFFFFFFFFIKEIQSGCQSLNVVLGLFFSYLGGWRLTIFKPYQHGSKHLNIVNEIIILTNISDNLIDQYIDVNERTILLKRNINGALLCVNIFNKIFWCKTIGNFPSIQTSEVALMMLNCEMKC